MAVIGYLGKDVDNGIQFEVSREVFRSLNNMVWSGSARYATHERHATDALTELTGLDPDSFTFDMLLTKELGVDPMGELVKLWTYKRNGEAVGLVIGGHAYGKYRWTIKKHNIKIKYTDEAGDLCAAEVSVELLAYLKGEQHNTTKTAEVAAETDSKDEEEEETPNAGSGGTTYTVKRGDCLWSIALQYYGDGSQYRKIYEANKAVIDAHKGGPNMIWPGDVLTIPP